MSVIVITGVAGLIGSEAALHFANQGFHVVGIDNDMRRHFFGDDATVRPNLERLQDTLPSFDYHDIDVRDEAAISH